MKINRWLILRSLVLLLCAYLVFLAGGFLAVKYGLTNTAGAVDVFDDDFSESAQKIQAISLIEEELPSDDGTDLGGIVVDREIEKLESIRQIKQENACKLEILKQTFPLNAGKVFATYQKTKSDAIVSKMLMASELRLKSQSGFQEKLDLCAKGKNEEGKGAVFSFNEEDFPTEGNNLFFWANSEEWQAIKQAVVKDRAVIERAAEEAGVEPRLIVASLIVEQLRLFHSQRELFKKFFEPLKILGNATKISLGVMGIKEATAIQVENNLKNPSSPYYLGREHEQALDFKTNNPAQERFERLTNEKEHYYSYLYGAFYLRQFLSQWERAGYTIQYRPEIIGTLFNVGFPQSKPNPSPKVGGSKINIGDRAYSFGSLAYEFYYSGELLEEFPFVVRND